MDKTDPIERVREARRRISREHADTRSLLVHYEKLQARHPERVMGGPEPDEKPAQKTVAADGAARRR
jgi:cell fate (sporulation/competence/biofilm development) regulator YlbF (YheA/YmcA/DUF963 family)